MFLKDLRETFKDVNFIGIRVLASRDSGSFIRSYCGYGGELYEKTMRDWMIDRGDGEVRAVQTYKVLENSDVAREEGVKWAEGRLYEKIRASRESYWRELSRIG